MKGILQMLRDRLPVRWITKDGKKIPIKKLDNSHLINILRMLHKRAIEAADEMISKRFRFYMSCPMPGGEMAQDAFWEEWEWWCEAQDNDRALLFLTGYLLDKWEVEGLPYKALRTEAMTRTVSLVGGNIVTVWELVNCKLASKKSGTHTWD